MIVRLFVFTNKTYVQNGIKAFNGKSYVYDYKRQKIYH